MTGLSSRAIMVGALLAICLPVLPIKQAVAQSADTDPMRISWKVRDRFRLFRDERDFRVHVESLQGRSILAGEQMLELQTEGLGWARNMVKRLCIDLHGNAMICARLKNFLDVDVITGRRKSCRPVM